MTDERANLMNILKRVAAPQINETNRLCQRLAAAPRLHDGVAKHAWDDDVILTAGIHNETLRGSANAVGRGYNDFLQIMQRRYRNFEVLHVNSVQLANGTCMYITFRV